MARTQANLRNASVLRAEMQKHICKSASDSRIRLGTAAHASKMKERAVYLQDLTDQLATLLPRARSVVITLRRCISDLQRRIGALKASVAVCDKRIELRLQRPQSELVKDEFDHALQQERQMYLTVLEDLSCLQLAGQQLAKPLEIARHEMQSARLTLHLDRTGYTEKLLADTSDLLQSAEQYCRDANILLKTVLERTEQASGNTQAKMRKQIKRVYDLKMKIGRDMEDTKETISQAEEHLEKLERNLTVTLAMPERAMDCGADGHNDKVSAKSEVLSKLRSTIRSAAYLGPGGRDMAAAFHRFDRDGNGSLDMEEIRVAIRKACKISPSVISDVDIIALCELLDEDSSGAISIDELVDFLLADVDVDELQQEVKVTKDALERLKVAQEEALLDFRSKTVVWRINDACSKVTPIKGLELDALPSTSLKSSSRKSPPGFGVKRLSYLLASMPHGATPCQRKERATRAASPGKLPRGSSHTASTATLSTVTSTPKATRKECTSDSASPAVLTGSATEHGDSVLEHGASLLFDSPEQQEAFVELVDAVDSVELVDAVDSQEVDFDNVSSKIRETLRNAIASGHLQAAFQEIGTPSADPHAQPRNTSTTPKVKKKVAQRSHSDLYKNLLFT